MRLEKKIDVDLRNEIYGLGYNMEDYAKATQIVDINSQIRVFSDLAKDAFERSTELEKEV